MSANERVPERGGPATSAPASEARRGLFWVGLVVALLGGQVLLMLVMVYVATSDRSFAIEPDYYRQGLQWDRVAAQSGRNRSLGWTAEYQLSDEASVLGERTLTCSVRDRSGRPLGHAAVDLVAFSHARGNERASVTLTEFAAGAYRTRLRMRRSGVWEFRLAVRRGSETFTNIRLFEVAPARGS